MLSISGKIQVRFKSQTAPSLRNHGITENRFHRNVSHLLELTAHRVRMPSADYTLEKISTSLCYRYYCPGFRVRGC